MDTKGILKTFINKVIDRDAVGASDAIQSVLALKTSEALNKRKSELTNGLFNANESVEEDAVAEEEKDNK